MSVRHREPGGVRESPASPVHARRVVETLTVVSVLAVFLGVSCLFASFMSAVNGYQQTEWQRDPATWASITVVGVVLLSAGVVGLRLAGRRRRRLGPGRQMSGEPLLSADAGPLALSPRNTLAVASLVLGILGVYLITAILALVFGYRAKWEIDRSGGRQVGRGMAVAGITLGWVWIAVLVVVVVLSAAGL